MQHVSSYIIRQSLDAAAIISLVSVVHPGHCSEITVKLLGHHHM